MRGSARGLCPLSNWHPHRHALTTYGAFTPDLSACGHAQAGGKVVYRAEKQDCQPFPILGDGKLLRGVSRNFEVFDPLEFLAEITQHIPDPGMQMVRYYGWYSNKMRGQRAKRADSAKPDTAASGTSRASRAPPQATGPPIQPVLDLSYVDTDEYLMAL